MADVTALYIRLSVDDDNPGESNSVMNQRDLLNDFIRARPELCQGAVMEFVDDGWSGTNFDRPSVKKLLGLARSGGVNCIVVKDLSRFGRNYIEVNEYIEQIFPFLGIRFISINDRYDSKDFAGKTAPIDIAFSSLVHDLYCKELSMKIHQVNASRAARGEFYAGDAPYGFVKSKTRKNKFEIDDEAAAVVRRIFTMVMDGVKPSGVALTLNNENVETPSAYHERRGIRQKGRRRPDGGRVLWSGEKVRKILLDERYTGVQIIGKSKRAGIGSSKSIALPESEWLRFPDSHDAVISSEVFQAVKVIITRPKKTDVAAKHSLESVRSPYRGKIRCGCCGYMLGFNRYGSQSYYKCGSTRLSDDASCFVGRAYLEDIDEIVLASVKTEIHKRFDRTIALRGNKASLKVTQDSDAAELKRLEARRSSLERRGISLYEDYADGRLDKQAYLAEKTEYAEELAKVNKQCDALRDLLHTKPAATDETAKVEESFLERFMTASEVTDEMLSLIDCVIVHDPERIEIRFAFGDTNSVEG